ncbi:hypothetical protein PV10_08340 [Exophiala mesophila]|uniref:methionyl-tRNA formyltransferase n=1 Tax=Exophiala mesophila TaxID=212818 RepID=A0A0D1Z435_EXOME|nr:uncharacterized protein PV10_08340 [Exophiala mesophila]KIV88679.1 hypothetical protein PV10_08340 [Exophiala mesophila]
MSRRFVCRLLSQHQYIRQISDFRATKQSSPLRILFCGSDTFSIHSLRALYEAQKSETANIISIDVVTKPDRSYGRDNKNVYVSPIKQEALSLGLPIHQIATFTGWQPPVYDSTFNPDINLIVAVSFGLLIPRRIINGAEYGGLNVHPSMLPDLRGAAPLQWTIIHGLTTMGVSVQTLHPTKFDAGVVLDQTPQPGIKVPRLDTVTPDDLIPILAPLGASMLVDAIKNQLYVPPYSPVKSPLRKDEAKLAPKITTETCQVDFQTMTGEYLLRLTRGVGATRQLWIQAQSIDGQQHTLKLFDLRDATEHEIPLDIRKLVSSIPIGLPYSIVHRNHNVLNCQNPLFVNVMSEKPTRIRTLCIPNLTVAGKSKAPAARAAAGSNFFVMAAKVDAHILYTFADPASTQVDANVEATSIG